ncbi:MAG: SusC/RagA family TonB-linked outer membrane protein [Flavobacteriaceae bacterium]|nr:MAG: SusC/RagA family TonB-linked outer membrane protein [Flavobacteriaceae bacterium]
MKNFRIFLIALLLAPLSMFAQQTISGTVLEQASGTGLPGVSIIIKGTSKGASTDFDGNYTLSDLNTGDVLVFTYMGFQTLNVTFTGQATVNVSLKEDAQALNEVVVIGYGTARKKDLTGSVNLVNSDDFNEGANVSAQSLIQGKVAGVQITSGGGAPGEGQDIRIRGTGSLSLNSNPLIVVDGVPMSESNIGGSRNALNAINPADIASMTVLKDASSTAIFGSRAANGVIMITTKKGKLNQEMKVNFNTNTSMATVNDYVSVLDANQFTNLINATRNEDYISRLGTSNTNWQKQIYTTAVSSDSNLSISGSAKNIPYRISLGYTDTEGVLKTDEFKRTTAKLSLNPKFLDDALKIDFNVNGSYIENQFADRGAIGQAVGYDPTQAIYDASSRYGGYSYWVDPASDDATLMALSPVNPLALLNLTNNTAEVRRLITNIKAAYELPFVDGLNAVVNVGYDVSDSNGRTATSHLMPSSNNSYNGYKSNYSSNSENKLFDFYLNYTKDLDDDHSIGVMAGHSYQMFEQENNGGNSSFFTDADTKTLVNSYKDRSVLMSYFGRANYNYKDRYLVTATLRADASSKLNPDDRWGYFPSVALAWNVSNENFLAESDIINSLKVRVGYGEVGNVNGLANYQFLTRYTGSQAGASYQFGDTFYRTYRPSPVNTDLKWEIGNTLNAGIDYSLFDNRVSGSFDAYVKTTKDLIASSTVDSFTNFGNKINANIGDMKNSGIEFAINVIPVRTEDLTWNINYNISYNKNEVTRMPDVQTAGHFGIGSSIQVHEEGYAPYTFLVYEQVYDANRKPIEGVFVDRNNDGQINDADKYHSENPYADVIMGLSTSVDYKGWDLNIATRASFGNYVYDNVASSNSHSNKSTEKGVLRNLNIDYYNTGFEFVTDRTLLSDYYIQDASFFKIDNITLGYTVSKEYFKNVGFRFYASANNILTVTDYKGLDPEINGGIDNNFYPRPETYMLGVNIDF